GAADGGGERGACRLARSRDRTPRATAVAAGVEHDPKKREPVFGKDHAQTKELASLRPAAWLRSDESIRSTSRHAAAATLKPSAYGCPDNDKTGGYHADQSEQCDQ